MTKELQIDKISQAAKTVKVLAHPVRIKIMEFISDGEKHVGAIQKHTKLLQAVTSQHLKLMLVYGLVKKRRQKNFIFYSPNEKNIQVITKFIQDIS